MSDGHFHSFDPKREIMDFIQRLASGDVPSSDEAEHLEKMLGLIKEATESNQQIDATLAVKAMCSHLGMPEVGDRICQAMLSVGMGGACGLGVKVHKTDEDWSPDDLTGDQAEKFNGILLHLLRAVGIVVKPSEDDPSAFEVVELIPHGGQQEASVDVEAALTAFRAEIDQFEKTLVVEPTEDAPKPKPTNSSISKWL